MGCLKAIFVRAGCAVMLAVAIAAGVIYHREILDYIDAWRGRGRASFAPPSPTGPASASAALKRLEQPGGPAYVDLTAPELASIIATSLAAGRQALDSVQVALLENEVRVRGSLDLRHVPRNLLGPFASALNDREPVTIGGPLSVDSAGRLMLTVSSLTVKSFPFPRGTIPRLLQELRMAGVQGSNVPIPFGTRLADVRVTPSYVRFFRVAGR